jgi:hypothetical protein
VTPIGAKVRQYPSQFKVWWAKAAAVCVHPCPSSRVDVLILS